MKARELQIGDLLYYKGKFNAFPFTVESITKKKVGYHAESNEHRMYFLRLSDCEPIPLTTEILERNGFGKYSFCNINGQHQWTWWSDKSTSVSLWYRELNDDPKDGMMVRVDSPLVHICIRVDYLHQLQHALILCGIKKEIV